MRKLLNSELNRLTTEDYKKVKKVSLVLILDNVRSQHNIGAVFRTSDAFLVDTICLCGITATPPNPEIHKSALGSENTVAWKYYKSTMDAVNDFKALGYKLIAVEQAVGSTELSEFKAEQDVKYAVVFGNEVKGVSQEIVDICDCCVEIAQYGTKHSLNISVSAGIVIWEFFKQMSQFIAV
jgi:23S rRNA (guanosine2251-2'-O)-methyltransferase